jgi:hypothetical protein
MGMRRHELETHIAEIVRQFACDCSGDDLHRICDPDLTLPVAIILIVSQVGGSLDSPYPSVQTALSAL